MADATVVSTNILVVGGTSSSGDREVLGLEDGGTPGAMMLRQVK